MLCKLMDIFHRRAGYADVPIAEERHIQEEESVGVSRGGDELLVVQRFDGEAASHLQVQHEGHHGHQQPLQPRQDCGRLGEHHFRLVRLFASEGRAVNACQVVLVLKGRSCQDAGEAVDVAKEL